VAGDFDGDGRLDCVVAADGQGARYTVMLGDGRGALRAGATGPLGAEDARPEIAAVDLNGDGKLDLVSAHRATVLLGKGDGSFGAPTPFAHCAPEVDADRLVLGDFDRDGKLDVVLVRQGAQSLPFLSGRGDGTFGAERSVDAGAPVTAAAATDLDGDGKLDLAVGSAQGILLLFGRGDGTFEPARRLDLDLDRPVVSVAAADLDGDGEPDLVVALGGRPGSQVAGNESLVLRNQGGRAFRPIARLAASGALTLRDVDGDGLLDLVAHSGSVSFLAGNGDGTFREARVFGAGDDLALADVDHDGLPDLLLIQNGNPLVRVLHNLSR
jgi:FG-GAP-like repeat